MTNKQRILRMVERWPDDISYDDALYHLHVMQEVMESIKEVEEGGKLLEFDEAFDELERECDAEENAPVPLATGQKEPKEPAPTHRGGRLPKNGPILPKAPKKVRKQTS